MQWRGEMMGNDWVSQILNHKYFSMAFIALWLLASSLAWIDVPLIKTIIKGIDWPPLDSVCKVISLFCGIFFLILGTCSTVKGIKRMVSQEAFYKSEIGILKKTVDDKVAEITNLKNENSSFRESIASLQEKLSVSESKKELIEFSKKYEKIYNDFSHQKIKRRLTCRP
jgi:hypothetical protein